jgi:hypothetical protein
MPFRELHMRTISGRRYNFCCPNTHLDNSLNSDGLPKNWSKPINHVDAICMRHDIAYESGNRSQADENMLRELNELDDRDLTCNELVAKYFTRCVIGTLYRLRKLIKRL